MFRTAPSATTPPSSTATGGSLIGVMVMATVAVFDATPDASDTW